LHVSRIAEARYEIHFFVDQDNHVSDNWIESVSTLMAEHKEVAPVRTNRTVSEEFCQLVRAISELMQWPTGDEAGDITERGVISGARGSVCEARLANASRINLDSS